MGFGRVSVEKLTAVIIGITILVIAAGGVIRIYDAGESCPDWPTCFGTWGFDISEEDQKEWFDENPSEIDSRGSSHTYTSFQIFTEWIHRLLAGALLGPLVILNWLLIRKDEELTNEVKLASLISVLLIGWQGFLGYVTVRLDNLHWSVALHLASALLFLMSLVWIWLTAVRDKDEIPSWIEFDPILAKRWTKRIAILSFGTFLTLFLGVFVSTTPGANQGCGVSGFPGSWPLCNDSIYQKVVDFEAQSQIIHRFLVSIVGAVLIITCYIIWKENKEGEYGTLLCKWIWISSGLYFTNIGLGGLYVLSAKLENFEIVYFELLSLIHLLLASLIFVMITSILLTIKVITLNEKRHIVNDTTTQ
ncbi:MAG: COX15/CtaA family protein [Candidatus Thalassarchaeaceae archaeon]|jgi:heme A synthase